jgi:hypothetical protein
MNPHKKLIKEEAEEKIEYEKPLLEEIELLEETAQGGLSGGEPGAPGGP